MSYEVEILADSIAPGCPRLTSFRLRYPKTVHGEHLRHRALSFSVSSGRAIPVRKQLEQVRRDPAMPAYWGREKSGMSPGAPFTPDETEKIESLSLRARDACLDACDEMVEIGVHKSLIGRHVFTWAHYEMVCTGCLPGWMNFFALRCHEDADPTIRRLAVRMAIAYRDHTPEDVGPGGYHASYWTPQERDEARSMTRADWGKPGDRLASGPMDARAIQEHPALMDLVKLSVARTARVSYEQHGIVDRPLEKDFALFDRELALRHWSIFEHVARAPFVGEDCEGRSGNLPGWIQLRQTLRPNVHTDFDFSALDRFRSDWPE